jgi:type IV pilus assembly protein PilF
MSLSRSGIGGLAGRLSCILFFVMLWGCGSTPGGDGARQAMSQESPTSDTRQKAKVRTDLAALYLQDNRLAIALEEARLAIAADKSYAPAYNIIALTHMMLGENAQAEENFERALKEAPGDPEITNNYGWFLCQTGRETKSIEYFLRAARNPLYSSPTRPYTSAGICLVRLKDDKGAEQNLQRALQYDPRNPQAMFWMADIAYRNRRYAEAKQWLFDLEKLVELDAEVTWLALRAERRLGNREGEARHAAQLRRKFANSPEHKKLQQGEYE